VVAIAVLSHDFADGFNTYTITSQYGNDRRRALALVADALAPVTGAAITLMLTIPQQILGLPRVSRRRSPLPGILRHPSCRRS
jgi:ZIP family zinc transporter